MSCIICKRSNCSHDPYREYKYTGNTVVYDALKQPDVLLLLTKMIECQGPNPQRFTPVPSWFQVESAKDGLFAESKTVDMPRVLAALMNFDLKSAPALLDTCTCDADLVKIMHIDTYMLLRFAVLSMPMRLIPVNLTVKSTTVRMYKIVHTPETESRFLVLNAKPTYLYHGSPMTNWHSITHNGIKVMSGTQHMTTGAVHGDGIYLTDLLTRSHAYCQIQKNSEYMIGVYEVYDSKKYVKQGDIHVVPSQDLLLLRYLLWISGRVDVGELGKAMNQLLDNNAQQKAAHTGRAAQKAVQTIVKRVGELEPDYKVSSTDNVLVWSAARDGLRFDITFTNNFPFDPPEIHVNGKRSCVLPMWKPSWSLYMILESFRIDRLIG